MDAVVWRRIGATSNRGNPHPALALAGRLSHAYAAMTSPDQKRVALFVTCLVDLFRPSVGFAAVKLLEDAGYAVAAPARQTCCGQPAYNAGDRESARAIARQVIDAFDGYDYVVAPSGSCAGMLKHHYPALFEGDAEMAPKAKAFAERVHELVSFLYDVARVRDPGTRYDGVAAYHDACSGLRELGIKRQPRALLGRVVGLSVVELARPEVCCGFGGTFCIKYADISIRMVSEKTADIAASGADTLLAGDMGCLMNMAGRLKREGSPVRVRHVAEVLAGMTGAPAIGDRPDD